MDKIVAIYKGEDGRERRVVIVKIFQDRVIFIDSDGKLNFGELQDFSDCEER